MRLPWGYERDCVAAPMSDGALRVVVRVEEPGEATRGALIYMGSCCRPLATRPSVTIVEADFGSEIRGTPR